MNRWVFVVLAANLLPNQVQCSDDNDTGPVVTTKQGAIRGNSMTINSGRKIQAFQAIPYAKPPVGELRFKDPEAGDTWIGIRHSTEDSPICPQMMFLAGNPRQIAGQEDCLYLSIYTPNVTTTKKYPVMHFIHGGGFLGGSSIADYYGPNFLLKNDIILVASNYRLGALGFATTEDDEMGGNFGLKDQALAVKWVKENIASFGGDPDKITLFGESAGGSSVHLHMLSPMSRGLFNQAILMSGTSYCPWGISPSRFVAKTTKVLAQELNCSTTSSKEMVSCLRKFPAEAFLPLVNNFVTWNEKRPIAMFPIIEPDGAKNPFITARDYNKQTTIPVMIGVTSHEGALQLGLLQSMSGGDYNKLLKKLDQEFFKVLPQMLMFDKFIDEDKDRDSLSMKIRNFYFEDKPINKDVTEQFVQMMSDAWFFQGTLAAIKMHNSTAYAYMFSHKGEYSVLDTISNYTIQYGVSHADDLLYIFPMKDWVNRKTSQFSEVDKKVSDDFVDFLTNFATYGKPSVGNKPAYWKPYDTQENEYLAIKGDGHRIEKDFLLIRNNFWENVSYVENFTPH